jgi:hypothetical protein
MRSVDLLTAYAGSVVFGPGSRFRLGLRCVGKAHARSGGSLDLPVGQIEPRTADALHPIATVGRKGH